MSVLLRDARQSIDYDATEASPSHRRDSRDVIRTCEPSGAREQPRRAELSVAAQIQKIHAVDGKKAAGKSFVFIISRSYRTKTGPNTIGPFVCVGDITRSFDGAERKFFSAKVEPHLD